MKGKIDFRHLLILMYLNEKKDIYSYEDIAVLIGVTNQRAYDMILYLRDKSYLHLTDNAMLELAQKGVDLLKKEGLYNINIFDLYNKELPFKDKLKKPRKKDSVYVPKDFDKKFMGYK